MASWTGHEWATFLVQFFGVLVALLVVVVALYKDDWNAWRKKPKLTLDSDPNNPVPASPPNVEANTTAYELRLVLNNESKWPQPGVKVRVRCPERFSDIHFLGWVGVGGDDPTQATLKPRSPEVLRFARTFRVQPERKRNWDWPRVWLLYQRLDSNSVSEMNLYSEEAPQMPPAKIALELEVLDSSRSLGKFQILVDPMEGKGPPILKVKPLA